MHVLFLHQFFSTRDGSGGTRGYEFARALVARGHRVTVICGNNDRSESGLSSAFERGQRHGEVGGMEVIEMDLPYSTKQGFAKRKHTFARYAIGATRLALRQPCDLILATSPPLTVALAALLASGLRRKPMAFEVRDLWPEFPYAMGIVGKGPTLTLLRLLERASYRHARACIGLAPGIVQAMTRHRRPDTLPPALIPNGCDLDLFGEHGENAPRPPGVGQQDLMAIYAGALSIANGVEILLDAACLLRDQGHQDIKIVIVGSGKTQTALAERIEREQLHNCLLLTPMPRQDVPAMLRCADIGLMILANIPAFAYATSPNKFFDYLATPLPVLVNNPGWIADMVEQHELGWVVPPSEPRAIAKALIQASRQRTSLRPMREAAGMLARQRFDRAQLAETFIDTLEAAAPESP